MNRGTYGRVWGWTADVDRCEHWRGNKGEEKQYRRDALHFGRLYLLSNCEKLYFAQKNRDVALDAHRSAKSWRKDQLGVGMDASWLPATASAI
jgi:hypothetical protein